MAQAKTTSCLKRKEKWQQSWDKLVFNGLLNSDTVAGHQAVLSAAESALAEHGQHENDAACLNSSDPVVRQGWALKKQVESQFHNKYAVGCDERVLIHVPAPEFSPAGYSLFTNLAESLSFLGVPTRILGWNDRTSEVLEIFRPTVLLTSDHTSYLERLDWVPISAYSKMQRLRVGLTASIEAYENTPLPGRLAWAKQHGISFYYTFRDKAYVKERADYQAFFDAAFPMLYLPFGANILHYYPVGGFKRDLDYVIMATRKSEHMAYMRQIASRHRGFIDGPGWSHVKHFSFNRDRDRYIYARARVGLNVHLPEQLEWACEVNERTYQLAACGVPQLMDHPRLIDQIYAQDAVYVADSKEDYWRLFREIIANPVQATERALRAQKTTFAMHTTFHRAEDFIGQLTSL